MYQVPQYLQLPRLDLDTRKNFELRVYAAERHHRCPAPSQRPETLSLRLKVDVIFYTGDIKSDKMFTGHSLLRNFEVKPSELVIQTIRNGFFHPSLVPFSLDDAFYKETRFLYNKQGCYQVSEDCLFQRLSSFLQQFMADPANTGQVDLVIQKWVVLPEQEVEAWLACYEKQDMQFKEEYEKSITRPRTVVYFYDAPPDEDKKTCCVCLDDLGGPLISTECLHVFHKECLMPWLETSVTCPLCRYELPTFTMEPTTLQKQRPTILQQLQQRTASGLSMILGVEVDELTSLLFTCFGGDGLGVV